MMSFMSDYQGNITYYNQSGETVSANAGTREFVAYVPQGNTLFSGTIRENIRMGNLNATDEEMIEALKMASAYDFVAELPKGIDTVIGERGHGLSEGQAQRIAIARALYSDPEILVLDEATSALDNETETAVMEAIDSLQGKITMIIVAHRLTTIKNCDKIYEIIDGKAIERSKNDVLQGIV